jgi:hypothetical protein
VLKLQITTASLLAMHWAYVLIGFQHFEGKSGKNIKKRYIWRNAGILHHIPPNIAHAD